ncbi:transmembrane glucosamine N-acetyltransferase NagX [Shewanella maritima]|uniref:transmembrane glucosamine N-acetyltransferase NagX n=1 Tax=Shewanella maritima TaxID=2520507 RepID=UPI003736EA1C
MTTESQSNHLRAKRPQPKPRLQSLDALRGFDMFWILGAEGLFAALFVLTGWAGWQWFDAQMHHSAWHGMTFYDLIFPLFIFLSGVALGLSVKRLDQQPWSQRKPVYVHAIKRLLLLLILGVIYNHGWGGGIPAELSQIRYSSVLARIAFAWFIAAMLVWHTSLRTQVITVVGLLVGYSVLLMLVPVPNGEAGQLTLEGSINTYIDSLLRPGISYQNLPLDPEGVLSHIPAAVNAIVGSFVGRFIVSQQPKGEWFKAAMLALSGVIAIALGYGLSGVIPINKSLWTSTFVLVTLGWSMLILAVFYSMIDILKWRKWAFGFVVIGTNAIIIYLATSLINWQYLAQSLFGGVINAVPEVVQPLLTVCTLLVVQWLALYWLYKRKIFIRI